MNSWFASLFLPTGSHFLYAGENALTIWRAFKGVKLLNDTDGSLIRELFGSRLEGGVHVLLFTSEKGCRYCEQTFQLLMEISELSNGKVNIERLDLNRDKKVASELQVDRTPATVILASNGAKLFYFGMPSGFQLRCLVDDIVDASRGSTDLTEEARGIIRLIDRPVDIKVFVMPSCPHSPTVVRAAHRFAMENPQNIRAQMIESLEFKNLAESYGVLGVPKTIINDSLQFEGVLDDVLFAKRVSDAAALIQRRGNILR